MGHPAKITKFSTKSLLSLPMSGSKWDKAHFPHSHLIPSFFIDFYTKNYDLMSNRHFHVISYKTQQFSPFDDFFSSSDLSNYSFFTNMLKKIIWDKITAAVIKKK